ncbi:MAG: hypothetical protein KDB22_30270, partial [Planctomycetales bacterium]|nr:hypothetical protein [Planctomycetales bacterium]
DNSHIPIRNVQPLRGSKKVNRTASQGALSRPWALLLNAAGVSIHATRDERCRIQDSRLTASMTTDRNDVQSKIVD